MKTLKRMAALLLCIGTLFALPACGSTAATEKQLFAMNSAISIKAYGKTAEAGIDSAVSVINSLEAALDPEQRDVYAAATRDSEAHTLRPRTVAVQVVNGLNYDFRCLGEDGRRYSVIIHRPLPQSGQGPRVISIRELPAVD